MTESEQFAPPPQLLGVEHIARIMHVSVELARKRMASGRWPSVKPSHTRYMTWDQIHEAIAIESTPAAQASATSARPPVAPNRSGLSSRSRRKRGAA